MSKYNFTLKETDGEDISLEDFKGKKCSALFYPKDNTSGCTTEAVEFRDLHDEFKKTRYCNSWN